MVKSLHGFNNIKSKCFLKFFGIKCPFFILPQLSTFDGIIGLDTLTQAGATIDLTSKALKFSKGTEEILFHKCRSVNFTKIDDIEVPPTIKNEFIKMMNAKSKRDAAV